METMDSAIKLVVMKKNPTTEQESDATYDAELFEDWEVVDEPSAFTKMMRKVLEALSRRLIDALLILAAVMLAATVITELPVLAAITIGSTLMAIVIAMFRIVKC